MRLIIFWYTIRDCTYYVVIKLNTAFIKVGGVAIVLVFNKVQKNSLKSGNSAIICLIESFCKVNSFFFGLVSKLGYFLWYKFLFNLNFGWLTKQHISLRSMLSAVSLLLYNLYEWTPGCLKDPCTVV